MSPGGKYFAGVLACFAGACLVGHLAGCASAPHYPNPTWHGIPNFRDLGDNVYASGQPPDASFDALFTLGVRNIVMLDDWSESPHGDNMALLDFTVCCHPITFSQQIFWPPSDAQLHATVRDITPGTLVHCLHGEDRTGLIVACYRLSLGWTKAAAEKEMRAGGFTGEPALVEAWQRQRVEDWR